MAKKESNQDIERRINIVLLFFLLAVLALVSRLFTLQILNHQDYVKLASRQHRVLGDEASERGTIYATEKSGNLVPLALNRIQKNLVASPKSIQDIDTASSVIAEIFGIKKEEILEKISNRGDQYEVILKDVASEKAEKTATNLPDGFFFEEEQKRAVPSKELVAHVLGFASKEDFEEVGRYGLERYYNRELSGEKGFFEGVKDGAGFFVSLGRRITSPPKNGSDLVLTVDYNIQLKAADILSGVVDKWKPASGSVLVIDPKTGKILAQQSSPTFDPNEYFKETDFSVYQNPFVEFIYELGSVIKPITLASAVNEGLVNAETTYEDRGEVKFGGYTIKNFDGKAYHVQTMTQVLEKSLNTGAVYVSRRLGKERHYEYLKRFGFGETANIDLPGEVEGDLSNLNVRRDIDFATASFGQGIAVTPLQMALAMGVIANGGKLMRPFVVEKIIDGSGNERKIEPQTVREVISKETAETVTKMLVSAVRSGFENKAGVKGYFVAGKTGTAQIPNRDRPGYSDKVIHTFVGYAPAFDPRFLIYIQINEPIGNRFAANTLTPAFHDLAEYILNYYEVPPDER